MAKKTTKAKKVLPERRTKRLLLRPFKMTDAPMVKKMVGNKAIAATTASIPHPYHEGAAQEWINTQRESFQNNTSVTFAITLRSNQQLIGSIGLKIDNDSQRAELGYLIAKKFWNKGYCTEAANVVLKYAFIKKGLNRVYAHHFTDNPASGAVMRKIGMTYEGTLRKHFKKWGVFKDLDIYGILKSDYLNG
jgi:RimJ/RimL family protein N-acetyltransferase